MKKAAIYARVSTVDKNQDPENQLLELREYCNRMEWEYTEYIDYASGSKANRPAYEKLMNDADRCRFDIVVVWKLDRFGRSLRQLIEDLELLTNKNIHFRCHTQSLDTSTPHGKLLFHMIGAFAEFERELISERVKAGLEKTKANGTKLGRPRVAVTEYTRNRIIEAFKETKSKRATAKQCRVSRHVVDYVLYEERLIDEEDIDL